MPQLIAGVYSLVGNLTWLALLFAFALTSLAQRRVHLPRRVRRVFEGATILLFLLSLVVVVPTGVYLPPRLWGQQWIWSPLLFPAGVLASLVFGVPWGMALTLVAELGLVVFYGHPMAGLLIEPSLVLFWYLMAYFMHRHHLGPHAWRYFFAFLVTLLPALPFLMLISYILYFSDFAFFEWTALVTFGRQIWQGYFLWRVLEFLSFGLLFSLVLAPYWRRVEPRYDVTLWPPLRFPWFSTRKQGMLGLFLLVAVPGNVVLLWLFSVFAFALVTQRVQVLLRQQLDMMAQTMSYQSGFLLESGGRTLDAWSKEEWTLLTPEERQRRLERLLDKDPFFHEAMLVQVDGTILARARKRGFPEIALTPGEQGLLALFRNTSVLTSLDITETPAQQPSFITLARRVPEQPNWVLVGRSWLFRNPYLKPILQSFRYVESEIGGLAFLLNAQGEPLILRGKDLNLSQIVRTEVQPQLAYREALGAFHVLQMPDGRVALAYQASLQGYSWSLLVLVPQEYLHTVSAGIGQNMLTLGASIAAVITLVSLGVLYYVTRSLSELAHEAQRIAAGDLDHTLPVHGVAEVEQLRMSFEEMRLSLRRRFHELQRLLQVSRRLVASLSWEKAFAPVLEAALYSPEAKVARAAIHPDFLPESPDGLIAFGLGEEADAFARLDEHLVLNLPTDGYQLLSLNQFPETLLPEGLRQSDRWKDARVLVLPLWREEEPVGVFYVVFERHPERLEGLLHYYGTLAEQLRLALTGVRLYTQAVTERQRLTAILSATPDAIFMTDTRMRVLVANPSARKRLEWPDDEARYPLPFTEAFGRHPELADMLLSQPETPMAREITFPDGRTYFVTVAPVHVENRRAGFVGILRDVTHFKRSEQAKAEFVAAIVHDLRSPITVIRGYATMLDIAGPLTERQRRYIDQMLHAVTKVQNLVENLLELSRIDMTTELKLEWVPLREMALQVLSSFEVEARKKNIQLEHDIHPETPGLIEADSELLYRALQNLIDNAIKFTPEGGRVTLRIEPRGKDMVRIVVEDTGIGISPEEQERLFDRFFQAERVRKMGLSGRGLGLAIVKSMVERHHGRIWVESELGKGARFYIELPVRQPKKPAAASTSKASRED